MLREARLVPIEGNGGPFYELAPPTGVQTPTSQHVDPAHLIKRDSPPLPSPAPRRLVGLGSAVSFLKGRSLQSAYTMSTHTLPARLSHVASTARRPWRQGVACWRSLRLEGILSRSPGREFPPPSAPGSFQAEVLTRTSGRQHGCASHQLAHCRDSM